MTTLGILEQVQTRELWNGSFKRILNHHRYLVVVPGQIAHLRVFKHLLKRDEITQKENE